MRWMCLGVLLGGCDGDSAPPENDDSVSEMDDSGAIETSDSGVDEGSIARGGDIVASVCESCHGPYNPLAARIAGLEDDEIASVIRNGSGYMPAQVLDDSEISDVIAYLRVTYPE